MYLAALDAVSVATASLPAFPMVLASNLCTKVYVSMTACVLAMNLSCFSPGVHRMSVKGI